MKMLKNILKPALCFSAVAVLLALGGCDDKKFVWDVPLAVDSHKLTLTEEGGATHILVYSTGDWQIALEKEITWGSLDRKSGSGCGEFVFSFSPNYGISRKVTVNITSGSLRDSIVLSQKGTLSSASVSFSSTSMTVADTAATIRTGFSTNVLFELDEFKARVTYYDDDGNASDPVYLTIRAAEDEEGSGGEDDENEDRDEIEDDDDTPVAITQWISNVRVSSNAVYFDVDRNVRNAERKAVLTVYIENADGVMYEPDVPLTVTQMAAGMSN